MEVTSRMKKFALIGGTACSIIGGVVIWKDSIAGQKVDQLKTEKELKKDIKERSWNIFLLYFRF